LQLWQGVAPLWFGREQVLKGVPLVAVVVGEILAMVMVMVMVMVMMMMIIPHRRMNSLLYLYL